MSKKFINILFQAAALLGSAQINAASPGYRQFDNLMVNNNLSVGGNETINGSISASNFTDASGSLFSGFRNYAVLVNQAGLDQTTTGSKILWAATPANNMSSGISLDITTGLITLPTSGTFLVEYSVRFNRLPPLAGSLITDTFTVQLQQTVAGTPTNITQPAVTSSSVTDNVYANIGTPISQPQIIGYALVTITSAQNNVLDLVVTFSGLDTMPAATGSDANAQMVILQLN